MLPGADARSCNPDHLGKLLLHYATSCADESQSLSDGLPYLSGGEIGHAPEKGEGKRNARSVSCGLHEITPRYTV